MCSNWRRDEWRSYRHHVRQGLSAAPPSGCQPLPLGLLPTAQKRRNPPPTLLSQGYLLSKQFCPGLSVFYPPKFFFPSLDKGDNNCNRYLMRSLEELEDQAIQGCLEERTHHGDMLDPDVAAAAGAETVGVAAAALEGIWAMAQNDGQAKHFQSSSGGYRAAALTHTGLPYMPQARTSPSLRVFKWGCERGNPVSIPARALGLCCAFFTVVILTVAVDCEAPTLAASARPHSCAHFRCVYFLTPAKGLLFSWPSSLVSIFSFYSFCFGRQWLSSFVMIKWALCMQKPIRIYYVKFFF